MHSSKIVFLSLGTLAAGFSFTGLPSTATVNIASSGTLIRDSSDPTAFSLLLRLDQQNGGSIIQTFKSEDATNIPFSFTPTESGSFIIEVISNLTPITDTTEPDKIYASSSGITVSEPDNQVSIPPPSSSSSSENAGTSSSSQNVNTATSADAQSTTAANANNGQGESTSSSSSSSSVSTSSSTSSVQNAGSATVTGNPSSSTNTASVTTNTLSSQSTGTSAKGELGSGGSSSPSATSGSGTSSDSSNGSGSHAGSGTSAISTNTSPPGSTGTLAPSSATSKSTNVGMIVGIVFGVLAFIAISLVLFLAYVRHRRRQRTDTFLRQLMTRQVGSSPLVFNMVTPPGSTMDGSSEYNSDSINQSYRQSGYSEQSNAQSSADMMETGTVAHTDLSHVLSMYSEPSVNSMYSDSPSIFYTAVPRVLGMLGMGSSSTAANPPPTPPPSRPLPPAPAASSPAPGSTSTTPSTPVAPLPHPQLAPGWVFPRVAPRASQLPPPKTDRQMDIYDRKVRLQGKLITLQGWGNAEAPPSEQNEIQMLKEQIRRLELLENSDWALGKSNELPAGLT